VAGGFVNPKTRRLTLELLQQGRRGLEAMFPWLGVLVVDVNDLSRASLGWVVMIAGAILTEWFFSYDFFREVLRLSLWFAMLLPIGAVLTACAGFKLLLHHFYRQVQQTNVAMREFFSGADRTNLLQKNDLVKRRTWAQGQYARVRLILASVGGIIFATGLVMLSLERVHIKETSEASGLSYGFSIALTLGGAIIAACAWHYYEKRNDEIQRIAAVKEQIKSIQIDELRLQSEIETEESTQPDRPQSSARVFVVGEGQRYEKQTDSLHDAGASDRSDGSAGWC
jgi:hypothetical protein